MLPWRSGHWRQALRARAVAATRFAPCQKVLPHLGLVPRAVRVAVLWNSSIQAKVAEWKDTQEPARSVELTLRSFEARSPEELDGVLAAIGHDLPDALLTFTDGFMIALRQRIGSFALANRLPMISEVREFAEAGGVGTYGAMTSSGRLSLLMVVSDDPAAGKA